MSTSATKTPMLAMMAAVGVLCWGATLRRSAPLTVFSPALADTASTAAATATPSDAGSTTASVPLPELPELEPIHHPAPSAAAVKDLDGRLSELTDTTADDPLGTTEGLGFVTRELEPSIVPAIAQRLQELRGSLKGGSAEKLLEAARKKGRRALNQAKRQRSKESKDRGAEPEGDWLIFVLALGRTDDDSWRGLVQLYGMLRMLESVGTTPAVREMVACYSYFGDLVRIDLQRAVARLKDKAVPALIEARKHDARRVRRWAVRQLDGLGRAIPGEAVSTTDPEVLADVLRAFGRTRDVDAVRVVLSFCNSERAGLRSAAREAVAAIGEPADWQLRDAYQSLTGKKAPRSWSWKRAARELFRLHDAARLAVVYRQMDEGLAALRAGRHQQAAAAFDKVLARSPLFERRAEMAPAYVALAAELASAGKRDEAMAALRKALRLGPEIEGAAKARSELATLEAEALIDAGTPDRFLLERALELDPQNEKARRLLASLEERSERRQQRSQQYLAAMIVGLLATVAMVLLARRRAPRRKEEDASEGPTKPQGTAPQPTEDRPPPEEPSPTTEPDDDRPTAPLSAPVDSDALPTREVEPPPDTDEAPTRELDEPVESDRLPTRKLDE